MRNPGYVAPIAPDGPRVEGHWASAPGPPATRRAQREFVLTPTQESVYLPTCPGPLDDIAVVLLDTGWRSVRLPSERGTFLSRDNFLCRNIQKRLEKIGLGWVNFQVLRRTQASLGHKEGVDPKVAADQRGHAIGVAIDTYIGK